MKAKELKKNLYYQLLKMDLVKERHTMILELQIEEEKGLSELLLLRGTEMWPHLFQ